MIKFSVVHGPNLNLLGSLEPEVYGKKGIDEINNVIRRKAEQLKIEIDIFQSNHEGELVDYIQRVQEGIKGIVINPAGLAPYSVALRDVLVAIKKPVIEVHLSNIYRREEFRQSSLVTPIAVGQITGLGPEGYLYALEH